MPRRRRSDLSRYSASVRRQRIIVNKMSEEEKAMAREKRRVSMAQYRASLSEERKAAVRERARMLVRDRRAKNKDRRTKRDIASVYLNKAVRHSKPGDSEIPRICRMCLSTDSTLEPLTSDELGDYLYQKIFDYTGHQLLPSEDCPSYLCSTCKSRLDEMFMFRWRCKRNVDMVNRFMEEQTVLYQ